MIKFSIDDSELSRLKQTRKQLNGVHNAVGVLIKEIDDLFKMVDVKGGSAKQTKIKKAKAGAVSVIPTNYSHSFTWAQRAAYMIKKSDTPVTTTQIVDGLIAIDNKLPERKKVMGSISAILSPNVNKNKGIKRGTNERGETVFSIEE